MGALISIIIWFVFSILLSALFGEDGYFTKKRIESHLDNIKYYQRRNNAGNVSFTYRGKEFSTRVECVDDTAYYKNIVLYINEEEVLSLYILIGTFVNCRTLWSEGNRNRDEVYKILKAASKTVDKRIYDDIKLKRVIKSYFK